MEKEIIVLLQLMQQNKRTKAIVYASVLMERIEEAMDLAHTDEELIRLSKMQRIVADVQQKLTN